MELKNYTLSINDRVLFRDVNIKFRENTISHILGNNGCGKSSFAKSCVGMLQYSGAICGNEKIILIGSSSNVPGEFCIDDITEFLKKRFDNDKVNKLYELLRLDKVCNSLPIERLSDGQKQKVKLYTFLSAENNVIILDEFTNALDKNSTLELYDFLNQYIHDFNSIIVNITHNLSDLEYMDGDYYYISKKGMNKIESKLDVIDKYIKGE